MAVGAPLSMGDTREDMAMECSKGAMGATAMGGTRPMAPSKAAVVTPTMLGATLADNSADLRIVFSGCINKGLHRLHPITVCKMKDIMVG